MPPLELLEFVECTEQKEDFSMQPNALWVDKI